MDRPPQHKSFGSSFSHSTSPVDFCDLHSAVLRVTDKCNQKCFFCDKTSPAPANEFAAESILRRMKTARRVTDSVVFTGGEPTLDKHLPDHISAARDLDFRVIRLETNGLMFAYPDFAQKIVSSGLTHAAFMHISHNKKVHDEIARLDKAWELAGKGLESLADFDLCLAACIPLLPRTISELPGHVEFLTGNFPHVKKIILQPSRPADGENGSNYISTLNEVLTAALGTASAAGVSIFFRPGDAPPPCLFPDANGLAPLFILPPATHKDDTNLQKIPGCDECYLDFYCGGIAQVYMPEKSPTPAGPALAGLILKQWPARGASAASDLENEFVLNSRYDRNGKKYVEEVLLRINYSCNERCLFCWVETGFANPDDARIRSYIEKLADYEVGSVCISGGEPTLNKKLIDYVALLRKQNVRKIWLQTNAVPLHREEKAAALAQAGVDFSLVSLHSHDSEISDMLTGLPGGFEKTVKGISNLAANGIKVLISHVINSFNFRTLEDFVRFAADNLDCTAIVFSVAAPIFGAMMNRGLIPKFSDIRGPLTRALDLCYELKVPFSGLAAMCGIPLCILDGNPRYYPDARRLAPGAESDDMLKTAACEKCGMSDCCFGLRKNYAEFYGTDELHPLEPGTLEPYEMDMWDSDFMSVYLSDKFGF